MKRLTTVQEIRTAALNRQSVICPKSNCFCKPVPAAFIINQIGITLARLLDSGMYLYDKEKPHKKGWSKETLKKLKGPNHD
jgi:hypothetical protein